MRLLRLLFPLLLALLVSYNGRWIRFLYTHVNTSYFRVIGTLPDFEHSCSQAPAAVRDGCAKYFVIPGSEFSHLSLPNEHVLGVGVGVLLGGSDWYCDNGRDLTVVYNSGSGASDSQFRNGLTLYQSGNIPAELCSKSLMIVSKYDKLNAAGYVGWKSGSFVVGNQSVVSWYKIVNDVFSSYIRAFIALSSVLLLLIYSRIAWTGGFGYFWYQQAILLLTIHFFASSSLLDFLLPSSIHVGYPLLMGGGTSGCICLIVACIELIKRKRVLESVDSFDYGRIALSVGLMTAFAFFYSFVGGSVYAYTQWSLAILLLPLSIWAKAPAMSLFALLFNSDVLANRGILAGFPTNASTHFLMFSFIFDAIEWLFLTSVLTNRTNDDLQLSTMFMEFARLSRRFGLNRITTSTFTREFRFQTRILNLVDAPVLYENAQVSQLTAGVMTARSPLIRVLANSSHARILKGDGTTKTDRLKGSEFCIFPLVHNQKVIGTLNITDYQQSAVGDPTQLILAISLVNRILPIYSECKYRESISPNVDDEKSILAIESEFSKMRAKTHDAYIECLNALSAVADCRIIVSKAIYSEARYLAYSSHNYQKSDAKFLETHSPRIGDTLTTSPANVALTRKSEVYINDIQRMYSIYPQFLIDLFDRNSTKSLLVSPVQLTGEDDVWGVIWLEFSNRMNRPESDLYELAAFLSGTISRVLGAHLHFENESRLTSELVQFLPNQILQKIRSGQSPREEEVGFLLNIDLSGSTALARSVGDVKYTEFISQLADELQKILSPFNFKKQMVIWDAFIFTCPAEGSSLSLESAEKILSVVHALISKSPVGFRAVLHFGDTTRDITTVSDNRSWGITGAALAESCKLEAFIKTRRNVMLMSMPCLRAFKDSGTIEASDYVIIDAESNESKSRLSNAS